MKKPMILDCTLRDGGYVNDNTFGRKNIERIVESLKASGVDLIEYGYIEDKKAISDDRTEYDCFENLFPVSGREDGNILMLLGEKYDIENLPAAPNQECYVRVTFHKKHAESRLKMIKRIIDRGYKVFIQPTVTMGYADEELVEMLKICNSLKPVSVAIVDTFGQMAPEDIRKKVAIFDEILDKDIAISFHAHNNLQNAYANAIEFISCINEDRQTIIDSSIYGMGRGAGNLPTELIMNYLNKNCGGNYKIEPILTVTDDVIVKIKDKNNWGYSLPYYLSGIYGVHPSYILTFMERKTLNSNDVKNLIGMISDDKKAEFDLEYARGLYNSYNNKEMNDEKSREKLAEIINKRKILLIGPGKSIKTDEEKIKDYIKDNRPYVISINGEHGIEADAIFFSNRKRYEDFDKQYAGGLFLFTSNIENTKNKDCFVFNYEKYLATAYGTSDNSLLMLLNILKSIGIKDITLAGFDGYSKRENFCNSSLELVLDKNYIDELNEVIKANIEKMKSVLSIRSITPSKNIQEVVI